MVGFDCLLLLADVSIYGNISDVPERDDIIWSLFEETKRKTTNNNKTGLSIKMFQVDYFVQINAKMLTEKEKIYDYISEYEAGKRLAILLILGGQMRDFKFSITEKMCMAVVVGFYFIITGVGGFVTGAPLTLLRLGVAVFLLFKTRTFGRVWFYIDTIVILAFYAIDPTRMFPNPAIRSIIYIEIVSGIVCLIYILYLVKKHKEKGKICDERSL